MALLRESASLNIYTLSRKNRQAMGKLKSIYLFILENRL